MGRGKGKWKKQVTVAAHEKTASGEEQKIVTVSRRGRPRKLPKKETDKKEETNMIEEELLENAAEENGMKRKRSSEIESSIESIDEENDAKKREIINDSVKYVGFRQSGSRRKNKPRRAAEVGVECYCY